MHIAFKIFWGFGHTMKAHCWENGPSVAILLENWNTASVVWVYWAYRLTLCAHWIILWKYWRNTCANSGYIVHTEGILLVYFGNPGMLWEHFGKVVNTVGSMPSCGHTHGIWGIQWTNCKHIMHTVCILCANSVYCGHIEHTVRIWAYMVGTVGTLLGKWNLCGWTFGILVIL